MKKVPRISSGRVPGGEEGAVNDSTPMIGIGPLMSWHRGSPPSLTVSLSSEPPFFFLPRGGDNRDTCCPAGDHIASFMKPFDLSEAHQIIAVT